jgi:hypothetical protein
VWRIEIGSSQTFNFIKSKGNCQGFFNLCRFKRSDKRTFQGRNVPVDNDILNWCYRLLDDKKSNRDIAVLCKYIFNFMSNPSTTAVIFFD